MAKFIIKWPTDKVEKVEQSDCETIEQLVNTKFGRGFDIEAYGVTVELVGEPEVEEAKKPEAPKKVEEAKKPEAPKVHKK